MSGSRFDLMVVLDRFERSISHSEDDVNTDLYLEGYTELNKFFTMMGSVFSFVSNDVSSKIDILEEFRRNKENADQFDTFHRMLSYEKDGELLVKPEYVSASRTLLRLHRGLDFIREFLADLERLGPTDKTASCCQSAYNRTLANFHPWLVRKGAVVAMYAMPNRDQLLDRVCLDKAAAIECLPQMLAITDQVYDRTQRVYTLHDLHALP